MGSIYRASKNFGNRTAVSDSSYWKRVALFVFTSKQQPSEGFFILLSQVAVDFRKSAIIKRLLGGGKEWSSKLPPKGVEYR